MQRLSAWEFAEILADYRMDPWGDDWRRSAMVAEANINLHRKKGDNPFDGDTLIPRVYPQANLDTPGLPDAATEQFFQGWFDQDKKLKAQKDHGRNTQQDDQHVDADEPQ